MRVLTGLNRLGVALLCILALAGGGCAELGISVDDVLASIPQAPQASALNESTVAAGLREALDVGARKAVDRTSVQDGFWANPLLRIPLPDKLEQVGSGLRAVGFGGQVDELEVAMNRAAERASGEAVDVFVGAIRELTIQDAMGILQGPNDAATTYLRRTSGTELERRFSPIVGEKMHEVGLVRVYDQMLGRLNALPLVPKPDLDLQQYVTSKAVDGLFLTVAEEEARIRTDPAARVTDLLRTVFAK